MGAISSNHSTLPFHECIDGHSRKVSWLKVGKLNSNPKIIASYFMELVASLKVCPRIVRTDCGTENVFLAAMQCFLRGNYTDELPGLRAHCYGNSQQSKNRSLVVAFVA